MLNFGLGPTFIFCPTFVFLSHFALILHSNLILPHSSRVTGNVSVRLGETAYLPCRLLFEIHIRIWQKRLQNIAETPPQGKGPGGLVHGHLDAGRRRDRVERGGSHLQLGPKVLRHPCAQVSVKEQQ